MTKQYLFILLLCSTAYTTGPVFAIFQDVELESTGHAVTFNKNPYNTYKIVTSNDEVARYQAHSKKYLVNPGDALSLDSDITVAGRAAIGFLTTCQGGWLFESPMETGQYNAPITFIVPNGQTETCLIVRNNHLTEPGQADIHINRLKILIEKESELGSKIATTSHTTTENPLPTPSLNSRSPFEDNTYQLSKDDLLKFSEGNLRKLANMVKECLEEKQNAPTEKDALVKDNPPTAQTKELVSDCWSRCEIL